MSASGSKPRVNLRSTAVKRIMQEAAELADPDEDDFVAAPLETDIFEWHCTLRGIPGTEFEGGLYHLRILLPPTYPMSAPDIVLLTPNGRFELGKKICIDGLTSFHAGSWQPAWGVRTAILGLRSFWMQAGEALSAIGALDYSKEERRRLAKLSHDWECPTCGAKNRDLLSPTASRPSTRKPGVELTDSAASASTDGAAAVSAADEDSILRSTDSAKDPGPPTATSDTSRFENANHHSIITTESSTPADDPSRVHTDPAGLLEATVVTTATENATDRTDGLRQRLQSSSRIQASDLDPSPSAMSTQALREQGTLVPPSRVAHLPAASISAELDDPTRRKPFMWIDIAIFVLSSLLFLFIARRMARTGPLDDLEQA